MMNPSQGLTNRPTFVQAQWARLRLRLWLVATGTVSAVAWTGALIGLTHLRVAELTWIGVLLIGAWLILSLPILYVQLCLIVDMIGYVVTGRVETYPYIHRFQMATTQAAADAALVGLLPPMMEDRGWAITAEHRAVAVPPRPPVWTLCLVWLMDNTSPLACFSNWALVVLARLPESSHALPTLSELRHEHMAAEQRLYYQAAARIAHS
jgi:hypothetical protein